MKKALFYFYVAMVSGGATWGSPVLREVTSTSCKAVPIELGVGMTTQIVFEQEPKVTLFADQTHFKVVTNPSANRSIAIIPVISGSEIEAIKNGRAGLSSAALAAALNESVKTNLFVFFDNNNQLMFELRFTEKKNADYLVKVKQVFNSGCAL
jgi:hypothetical protein